MLEFIQHPRIPTKEQKEKHQEKYEKKPDTNNTPQAKNNKQNKPKKDCKCENVFNCNCTENNLHVSREHMCLKENMSRPR